MSEKAVIRTIVGIAVFVAAALAGLAWYYFFGAKPRTAISKPVSDSKGDAACRFIGRGEVLLVIGNKATLIDTSAGREKWTADLASATAPTAAPASGATASTAATADPALVRLQQWNDALNQKKAALKTPEEIKAFNEEVAKYRTELNKFHAIAGAADGESTAAFAAHNHEEELAEARLKKEFDKLRKWNTALSEKRAGLKTELQTKAFNQEAARYHAELAEARTESARLGKLQDRPVAAAKPESKSAPALEEKSDFEPEPRSEPLIVGGQDRIWVTLNRTAIGLDRESGRIVKQVGLPDVATEVLRGPNSFFVISEGAGSRHVTRIAVNDGTAISLVVPPRSAQDGAYGSDGVPSIAAQRSDFSAAGDTLLELDATLAEQKITEREAIKEKAGDEWEKWDKSSKGGWGGDAAKMATLVANDAARLRTGGKDRIDDSKYRVTVSHPVGGAGGTWSGTVQGRPVIFSSATLDFLSAGTQLLAFDRTGKQLWESKLGQPVAFAGFAVGRGEADPLPPCLEISGAVCIYDRAFLTAFERGTGNVLWRLPSVGIRKVQADGSGMLYLCSDNASAESLRYGQDARIREGEACVTMKVDPSNGKILWTAPKYEDCFVSGSGIYATRIATNAQDAVDRVFDASKVPECRFELFKLSGRDGSPQWQWLGFHRPLRIEADGRRVSLLFRTEFQALKSLAL